MAQTTIPEYKKESLTLKAFLMTVIVNKTAKVSVKVYEAPTAQGRKGAKILLLKLDHIGDFITAMDAFRIIRNAFAGAEITLICLPALVGLAQNTGLFDRVAGFAAEPASDEVGKVEDLTLDDKTGQFEALLDGPYFLAADYKHDKSSRQWLDYVEAEVRAGFMANTEHGLDIVVPLMEWDVPTRLLSGRNVPLHADVRLKLLSYAITESLFEKPLDADLFNVEDGLAQSDLFRTLADDPRLKVGVSLGAGSELRQWSIDYWRTIIGRLVAKDKALIVFFGGKADQRVTTEITGKLAPGSYIDLVGAIALPSLPVYMNLLDAYIGCDTGLTHLVANLGIPTVNIYAGISNISVWRARGPKVRTVYADVPCAPCHLRFRAECPNNQVCMNILVADIVYDCFEQVMALGSGPA